MSLVLDINSYFNNTPVLEWSYHGFLNALKPYFISDLNSIENLNSIMRKRYLACLKNFLDVKEKQGLQNGHNEEHYEFVTLLLRQKEPETQKIWKIVELERNLENEFENKKIIVKRKSQIDGLELVHVSRQQQNLELVDELNSEIRKKLRFNVESIGIGARSSNDENSHRDDRPRTPTHQIYSTTTNQDIIDRLLKEKQRAKST
ncbi:1799_t:CDS:2, partial [Funneliformis mosseae]